MDRVPERTSHTSIANAPPHHYVSPFVKAIPSLKKSLRSAINSTLSRKGANTISHSCHCIVSSTVDLKSHCINFFARECVLFFTAPAVKIVGWFRDYWGSLTLPCPPDLEIQREITRNNAGGWIVNIFLSQEIKYISMTTDTIEGLSTVNLNPNCRHHFQTNITPAGYCWRIPSGISLHLSSASQNFFYSSSPQYVSPVPYFVKWHDVVSLYLRPW